MDEFKKWLNSVCFQKPTPEALDLAKDAWEAALKSKIDGGAEVPCSDWLGPKHMGCRISAPGILGRIRDGWKIDQGQRYAAGEMLKHMQIFAEQYYAGDTKAMDEFLQLYCLDETRP